MRRAFYACNVTIPTISDFGFVFRTPRGHSSMTAVTNKLARGMLDEASRLAEMEESKMGKQGHYPTRIIIGKTLPAES